LRDWIRLKTQDTQDRIRLPASLGCLLGPLMLRGPQKIAILVFFKEFAISLLQAM
jgi:hypothetical protein